MIPFNKDIPFNSLPDLPPTVNLETPEIYKACIQANKFLAELKGYCQTLPNPTLLLNTIVLQESKESNEIENIVTTQDELYRATLFENFKDNSPTKEVLQYREAMFYGVDKLKENNLITTNLLVSIMQILRNSKENIRKNAGTKLANPTNGNIIYTPPESEVILREKLAKLEVFINDHDFLDLDPIIKMALIHYQFEAIHPFTDGNGRTGRILNILYLLHQQLLDSPILYLSKYIIDNKHDYYRLLREVTEKNNWHQWVLFMINAVADTAKNTLLKINEILALKNLIELKIKEQTKINQAKELSELLISYPYIKISILEKYNIAKRQTASEYLKKLEQLGVLYSIKVWKETYFINDKLIQILKS